MRTVSTLCTTISLIPSLMAAVFLLVSFVVPTSGRAAEPLPTLTREQASGFARLALKGLDKEYPNKPEHVMTGPADVKGPRALHPAFYGCYDWHSSRARPLDARAAAAAVPRPAGGRTRSAPS